jgi:cephalosporin hydroxylase
MSYKDVEGWFNFEFFYERLASECPPNSSVVEVGVWMGKSLLFLHEQMRSLNKDATIFAVDTWRGSTIGGEHMQQVVGGNHYGFVWHKFVKNIKSNAPVNSIFPMCISSVEASRYFEDKSLFAVFIDADHSYESVKADISAWRTKIQPGGVIAGHDYDWPGVTKAAKEAFPEGLLVDRNVWEYRCAQVSSV